MAYTCGTNCLTVPFTATAIDTCCSNVNVDLQYYLGTNITSATNNCFLVNTTNMVVVVASDNCSNVVSSYFTVTVLPGPGSLAIQYQQQGTTSS